MMLGSQERLAVALTIEPRSLRAKLSADRAVTDDDLIRAATALEAKSEELLSMAARLRELAA